MPKLPPIDRLTMSDLATIVRTTRCKHRIRVRKWRKQMSGISWQVNYEDGRVIRWIEAPYPRTPISLAIFLHEVGHHVIGFDKYKHRCEEEYHVWRWTLDEMRRLGQEPDEKVLNRVNLSMQYAVGKALRRGIKRLPDSLQQFTGAAA